MSPPRGPTAPPSAPSGAASGSATFSRYAALLSVGDLEQSDDMRGVLQEAVEAVRDRVGWANLRSNSWESDGGL